MYALHIPVGDPDDLLDGRLSIGVVDPGSVSESDVELYDFGVKRVVTVGVERIVALASGNPAGISFAPSFRSVSKRMAANQGKVIRFPRRREKPSIDREFVTGYDSFARSAALYWREHGVGSQPLLAAGIFALSSIQTPISTCLKLFAMLGPSILQDRIPGRDTMRLIVKRSGAGLQNQRATWFEEYADYRFVIQDAISEGMRDDDLRRFLAEEVSMPKGLGLAKLSFTLALVGNNLGCLDARILDWAYTKPVRDRFQDSMARKRKDGTLSPLTVQRYESAERSILVDTPFYNENDPVGLARSQWMLWESLGPASDRTHTHEEMFQAVLDPVWRL